MSFPKNINEVNIELLFPESLYAAGEELYENRCVIEQTQIEKNLFNFLIQDGPEKYEVEWLKPLLKSQKATCQCLSFKANKSCKHVVAGLIAYHHSLKSLSQNTPAKVEKSSTLNINNILNNINKDDLKNFVKVYATNDKKFGMALKVHFARKVDLHDNEKKYKAILDAIIKPVTHDKLMFKNADVKGFLNIAREFHDQAQDAMALGQFGEAFILAKVLLLKLCYAYNYTNYHKEDLSQEITNCHLLLRSILVEKISPELKNNVIVFVRQIIAYSYYPYLSVEVNGVFLLDKIENTDSLAEILESHLIRKKNDEVQILNILTVLSVLFIRNKKMYVLDHKYINFIPKVGETMYDNRLYQEGLAFCKNYLKIGGDIPFLYLKFLNESQIKNKVKLAAELFCQSQDLRLVDFVLNNFKEAEINEFATIVNHNFKVTSNNEIKYLHFLNRVGLKSDIISYLEKRRDFRLLMQFDEYVLKQYEQQLQELYLSMVEQYLENHIGTYSKTFIDEIYAHLNQLKASKIINSIGLMIDLKFSHRISFNEMK